MSKYIHPATTEAALRVASNLLPDDYREVKEGHGHDPLNALVVGVHNSESVYFTNPDNEICGIAGVYTCLLYTSPSPRDRYGSRMPSSA